MSWRRAAPKAQARTSSRWTSCGDQLILNLSPSRRDLPVNELGVAARDYYRDYLPGLYASIGDPQMFFSQLGQDLQSQVTSLMFDLAGPDLPQETYLAKVGRLNAARSRAREQVLSEQVYSLEPEYGDVDQTDLSPQTRSALADVHSLMQELHEQD